MNIPGNIDDEETETLIQWFKPSLEEERGELERTSKDLNIDFQKLLEAYKQAELQQLPKKDWLTMENTHSRDSSWNLVEIRQHLENKRDFARIEEAIKKRGSLPAPIVLSRPGHNLYCIGGNSRLLACRGYGLTPTVLVLKIQ